MFAFPTSLFLYFIYETPMSFALLEDAERQLLWALKTDVSNPASSSLLIYLETVSCETGL